MGSAAAVAKMWKMRMWYMGTKSRSRTAAFRFRVFFPGLDLLVESCSFLLIHKRKACHTVFELEAIEKFTITVVAKALV